MKKILIVSYFFPPAGGGGVIRVAKFAKFLPFFGWQPIVLTVKKGFYPIEDQTLLREVSLRAEIWRVNYLEPGFWFKNRLWRSFLAYILYPLILLPDNQILWFLPALWRAYRIIKKEKIKIVFTSASSYTDHLVAFFLKKSTGVRWVADFRDEWTMCYYLKFPTPLHKKIAQGLERLFLKNADFVTTVSEGLTELYSHILNKNPEKFITITNGFDEEDMGKISNFKFQISKKRLRIVHIGSLYGLRQGDTFVQALKELKLQDISVEFIGNQKRISHRQAIEKMFNADVLLLILSPFDGPEVLTGKIFEYLAIRKPILALAPLNSGVAKLIKNLKVGEVCDPSNEEEIKTKVIKMYQKWRKNQLIIPRVNIEKYTRKNLTEKLAKIFDNLTQKRKIKLCLIGNIQAPQNQNLVKYFLNKNYNIHFITTKLGEIKGAKSYYLGSNHYTPIYFLKSLYKIRKIIRQINPDIVHGQDLVFAGIWAYLCRFRPFVATPWGSDVMNYDEFIQPEKYLVKKTLQKADLVTISSAALQKQAEKIGMEKNKAQIVHFGIDLEIFKKSNNNQSRIIFCPRAIGPIYNTDILIQSFNKIQEKNKTIRLALLKNVADKDYLLEIKKLIIKYNLVDKVLFWSKVPNKKMVDYYNRAEVIVSLSSSDGCSVSFLEAMACEKKIVATNLPYLEEWKSGKNFWLVPVRDVQATAEEISAALKYPLSKWQSIGRLNRQLIAQKAEINNNFEKLNKLYQDLI